MRVARGTPPPSNGPKDRIISNEILCLCYAIEGTLADYTGRSSQARTPVGVHMHGHRSEFTGTDTGRSSQARTFRMYPIMAVVHTKV